MDGKSQQKREQISSGVAKVSVLFCVLQPFNTIFFMGLSFHVALALIAHLIGYDMVGGLLGSRIGKGD